MSVVTPKMLNPSDSTAEMFAFSISCNLFALKVDLSKKYYHKPAVCNFLTPFVAIIRIIQDQILELKRSPGLMDISSMKLQVTFSWSFLEDSHFQHVRAVFGYSGAIFNSFKIVLQRSMHEIACIYFAEMLQTHEHIGCQPFLQMRVVQLCFGHSEHL